MHTVGCRLGHYHSLAAARYGNLSPDEPTLHALGALLRYVLTLSDLRRTRPAPRPCYHQVCVGPGSDYISDLRTRYQVYDTPIRDAGPAPTPPLLPPYSMRHLFSPPARRR